MAKRDKHNPIDAEKYNLAVASTELVEILLVRSEFEIKPEYHSEADNRKLSFSYDAKECHFFQQGMLVEYRFDAKVKSGNRILLRAMADFHVIFKLTDDSIDQEAACAFAKHLSRFSAYPYFRQHVAALSSQSGAELPVMPIIRQMPRNTEIKSLDSKKKPSKSRHSKKRSKHSTTSSQN